MLKLIYDNINNSIRIVISRFMLREIIRNLYWDNKPNASLHGSQYDYGVEIEKESDVESLYIGILGKNTKQEKKIFGDLPNFNTTEPYIEFHWDDKGVGLSILLNPSGVQYFLKELKLLHIGKKNELVFSRDLILANNSIKQIVFQLNI